MIEDKNPQRTNISQLGEFGLYQAKQRAGTTSTIPHWREDKIYDFKIPILKNQKKKIELTKKSFELKDKRKN